MRKNSMKILLGFALGLILTTMGCGFQSIPMAKNDVDAAMAEVTSQYKRRGDLIPNLVATVQGYASHEKETLTAVMDARAKASQINVTTNSPESLKDFQAAQGSLSQALGRLMMVAEKYPDLKANQNFRDLQAQLEGTENRITVARNRLIEAIKIFNNLVTVPFSSWTNSLVYHHQPMPQWTVENAKQLENAPSVSF